MKAFFSFIFRVLGGLSSIAAVVLFVAAGILSFTAAGDPRTPGWQLDLVIMSIIATFISAVLNLVAGAIDYNRFY